MDRRKQTARKTIRNKWLNNAKIYVQNIPAKRIQQEYRQYARTRRRRIKNQSIRKSQQCVSNTLQRRQCKKRTAHTSKCWIHLAKEDNLRIKPSNIPDAGKGLFAWKKYFPRNVKISNYTGRKMTKAQVDRKYGQGLSEYALCDTGKCIDANYTTDAAARFINDSRGSRFPNNSELGGRNYKYFVKSTKTKPHQEIFTSYGPSYWHHI